MNLSKLALAIVTLAMLFAFSGLISDGIVGLRTDTITQNINVTTGGGVTTKNVTLSQNLFNDSPSRVISITSNVTETPAATDYYFEDKQLTIDNLNAATTRILTVEYYADKDDEFVGALGPFLNFLIFGGILGAIAWGLFKGKN